MTKITKFYWPQKRYEIHEPIAASAIAALRVRPFARSEADRLMAHMQRLPQTRALKLAKELHNLFEENELVQEGLGLHFMNVVQEYQTARMHFEHLVELNPYEAEFRVHLIGLYKLQKNSKAVLEQQRALLFLQHSDAGLPKLSDAFFKNIPQSVEAKIRLQHDIGPYLVEKTGLGRLREELVGVEKPAEFLVTRLKPVEVGLFCTALGCRREELLLRLVMETQRPGSEGWPEMGGFLEEVRDWVAGRRRDGALEGLCEKIFPRF